MVFAWQEQLLGFSFAWQISRFTSASKKSKIIVDKTALCCAVYKIPWPSEVGGFQSGMLTFISKRNQFFAEQGHHIYGVFFRSQTEKDPANMGGHAEIHFVSMFGVSLFYNCMIDKSFRHVVGDQFCPYFLLPIFPVGCIRAYRHESCSARLYISACGKNPQ